MKKLILLAALGLSGMAHAEDLRIINKTYQKNVVFEVFAQVGKVSLIQLENDETLNAEASALGIGDATAWNLGVRGNNIMLKPAQKLPDTNVVIVTNKRTYAIELKSVAKGDTPTYILRFTYPDTEAAKEALEAKRAQLTAAAKAEPVKFNAAYSWRGENELLKPTAAWDDGRFTHLMYDHAGELPNFYKVMPDGSEALINTNIDQVEKNTVILQEVTRVVRARLNNEVIEIVNNNYEVPSFNKTGTGVSGTVRVDRGAL